ncbi:hypothetical protein [Lewinella sp. JB7]|uniref:hypothetical protein n=1 Tax=Lewinella sp. JB7 TaxID=2962887 RepID=UPI0020C9F3C9|nr:hypothetical protein [Lewinella sp. JB7]MCP9237631.1 hypothetical protein [Lewinella sp. JB7]
MRPLNTFATLAGLCLLGLFLLPTVLQSQLPAEDPLAGLRTVIQEQEVFLFYAQEGQDDQTRTITYGVDGNATTVLQDDQRTSPPPSLDGGTDIATGYLLGQEYGAGVVYSYRSDQGSVGRATISVALDRKLGSDVSDSGLTGFSQQLGELYTVNLNRVRPRTELTIGKFGPSEAEGLSVVYTGSDQRIHVEYFDIEAASGQLSSVLRDAYQTEIVDMTPSGSLVQMVDATAADVDLDGRDELLLVYWDDQEAVLEILEFSDTGEIRQRSRTVVFDNTFNHCINAADSPFDFQYLSVKIEAGDFVPEFPGEEFVVGLIFNAPCCESGSNEGLYLLPLREKDGQVNVPNWCARNGERHYYGNSGARDRDDANPLDLAAGDLDGDLDDELVMASISVRIFNLEKGGVSDPEGLTIRQTTSFSPTSNWDTRGQVLDNFLAVGNLDQLRGGGDSDFRADIVVAGQREIDDDFGSLDRQELELQVYRLASDANLQSPPRRDVRLENLFPLSGNLPIRRFGLAVGDADGGSIQLGTPTRTRVSKVLNPLVLLNAPPTHFDVFGSTVYDVSNLYGSDAPPPNINHFNAEYVELTDDQQGFETQFTSDYALAVNAEAGLSLGGFSMGANFSRKYGERFSKVESAATTVTLKERRTALLDDELSAYLIDFDVYEYPIVEAGNSGSALTHVVVTVPGTPQKSFVGARSQTIDYVVDHRHGNVFSYPAAIAEMTPVRGQVYSFSGQEVSKTSGFESNFAIAREEAVGEGVEEEVTTSTTVGGSIGGTFKGFGLKVSTESTYGSSELENRTSSYRKDVTMEGFFGQGEQSTIPGDYPYTVIPTTYWDGNGSLVLDYAVQLKNVGFWNAFYAGYDPAFLVLEPHKPEKGLENPDGYNEADRYRSRDIRFVNIPSAGESTTVKTRIYNYGFSEVAFNPGLEVCLYYLDPESMTSLQPISCQTVTQTLNGRLDGRDVIELSFDWDIPEDLGAQAQVVAIIDPADEYPDEVHDYPEGNGISNNVAWTCIFLPDCTLPPSQDVYFGGNSTALRGHTVLPDGLLVGPNPMGTHGWIQIPEALAGDVEARLYDPLGRQVRQWDFENLSATDRTLLTLGTLPTASYTLVVNNRTTTARTIVVVR